MIPRALTLNTQTSFFLLGPRGVGKTTWAKNKFPNATYINLGDLNTYDELVKSPVKIYDYVKTTPANNWIIIDEVTEIPLLGLFVKSLITEYKYKCILITSSIHALDVKMPALTELELPSYKLYPLTAYELGCKYNLNKSLQFGQLPAAIVEQNPQAYLQIYLYLFLREEVLQGKLVQNLSLFTRFLEVMGHYQCCPINLTEISRLAATPQNVALQFLEILDGLFFGERLPCFDQSRMLQPKFYLFDVGVFKTIQTKKSSICNKEIEALALETLFFQELCAVNTYVALQYEFSYWASIEGKEITFIAKNSNRLLAFIIKNTTQPNYQDFEALLSFYEIYHEAKLFLIYLGEKHYFYNNIEVIPAAEVLTKLPQILKH